MATDYVSNWLLAFLFSCIYLAFGFWYEKSKLLKEVGEYFKSDTFCVCRFVVLLVVSIGSISCIGSGIYFWIRTSFAAGEYLIFVPIIVNSLVLTMFTILRRASRVVAYLDFYQINIKATISIGYIVTIAIGVSTACFSFSSEWRSMLVTILTLQVTATCTLASLFTASAQLSTLAPLFSQGSSAAPETPAPVSLPALLTSF